MNKYNGRTKTWLINYYALTSFMWFLLTFPFLPYDRYEYHRMKRGCMQMFDE